MGIRVVLADDEAAGRRRLSHLIKRDATLELVAECDSGQAAVTAICELQPDLVLLDVQMPEIGGFDVIEAVGPDAMPLVVFVTAYDRFAVQAFEAHAADYLLKPFDDARFLLALSRAKQRLQLRRSQPMEGLNEAMSRRSPDRFIVRTGNRCDVIHAADIDWFEACDNYVKLHVGARSFMLRSSITTIEERLAGTAFMRIHRSTIVNVERISRIEPHNQTEFAIVLNTGVRLTSSRGYRDNVRAFMERR